MTTKPRNADRPRVLAIASGGGHWVQLLRLRPALAGCDVTYVTVDEAYRADAGDADFHVITDATRWNKIGLVRMALQIGWILARVRPDVIVTTGAAPGFFAIRAGRVLGARTVWLDSIANVERLSLSGERVGRYADLWLTQWPHLAGAGDDGRDARPTGSGDDGRDARPTGRRPAYRGAVL